MRQCGRADACQQHLVGGHDERILLEILRALLHLSGSILDALAHLAHGLLSHFVVAYLVSHFVHYLPHLLGAGQPLNLSAHVEDPLFCRLDPSAGAFDFLRRSPSPRLQPLSATPAVCGAA